MSGPYPSIFHYIDYLTSLILINSIDFEPILDDTTSSLEFESYEQYSRQEIPRLFRRALEAVVNEQAIVIEEQLRDQLVGIIQQCQDRAFLNYLNHLSGNASSAVVSEHHARPVVTAVSHQSTTQPLYSNTEVLPSGAITMPEDHPVYELDVLDDTIGYDDGSQLISDLMTLESYTGLTPESESPQM